MSRYAPRQVTPPPQAEPQAVVDARKRRLGRLGKTVGLAQLARIVVGTLLALLLIITWVGGAPNRDDVGAPYDWTSQLDAAAVENELNNRATERAPQQSVVNGWYANELALVQASQNTYMAASSARNGNLLVLIGLGIAGELIIRGAERAQRTRTAAA